MIGDPRRTPNPCLKCAGVKPVSTQPSFAGDCYLLILEYPIIIMIFEDAKIKFSKVKWKRVVQNFKTLNYSWKTIKFEPL